MLDCPYIEFDKLKGETEERLQVIYLPLLTLKISPNEKSLFENTSFLTTITVCVTWPLPSNKPPALFGTVIG